MRRALSLCVLAAAAVLPAQLPTPREALGHEVGADHFLANYTQLKAWWGQLAAQSDRMRLESLGETAYGLDMQLAIVSAPENLARIDELREINERLALGRVEGEAAARELAVRGRTVIWIDAGMHATESVAAQNILELVWQMVSRDDAEVRRILDEVVLLVCPANPDGMEMVANAYMATGRVGGIPVLYQRFAGHDNNRDYYAGNLAETRNIMGALYRRWYPQVVYNHHQTAPRGTILFTPPFRDPFNHNVDPLVIRGIDLVSAHMNHRFSAEGKPGVISRSGASYSTWWNGGLRTTVYFHNMVGILTEAFGSPTPSRVEQSLSRRVPYSDYPDPIATQDWHARQTIDYLQTANFAILDLASRYREDFLLNAWRMARRAIAWGSEDRWTPTPRLVALQRERDAEKRAAGDAGEGGLGAAGVVDAFEDPALRDPRSYVLPSDQPDFAAATRLVRALRRAGVEAERLTEVVDLPDGTRAPVGSFVLRAAQPFRAHLRDMMEPQWHPDDVGASGDPIRPYDAAGWTLAMQMGVEVARVLDAVDLPTALVTDVEVGFGPRAMPAAASGYWLDHRCSNQFVLVNRLLAGGERVHWSEVPVQVGGETWPRGAVHVRATANAARILADGAGALGVRVAAVDVDPPGPMRRLSRLRVGLFDTFGGNMPTGWTEWVLRDFEFPVELVYGDRVEAGDLIADFDVLLLHTGLPSTRARTGGRTRTRTPTAETDRKLQEALPPFEDWSNLAARRTAISREKGVPGLQAFVGAGGTLIAMQGEATAAIAHFDLPVEEGTYVEVDGERRTTDSSEFFVPGSLLRMEVRDDDYLGYGVAPDQVGMFRRSPVFAAKGDGVIATATWPAAEPVLASGWAIGTEHLHGKLAALRVPRGDGQFVLFGADVVYRGQPVGTFKLLFNAIQGARSRQVSGVRGE